MVNGYVTHILYLIMYAVISCSQSLNYQPNPDGFNALRLGVGKTALVQQITKVLQQAWLTVENHNWFTVKGR